MDSPKVIITNKKFISKQNYLENEIGLSTFDLALISFEKIINKSNSAFNGNSNKTYLI